MKTWEKLRQDKTLWNRFLVREKIIRAIREYFYKENFHEVETPILVPSLIPEHYLDIFETVLHTRTGQTKKMYLTASPEASLKKLLVAGIGNCFEITKSFRNEETGSTFHNPEFTILEWYRVNADYKDIMNDCQNLLLYMYKKLRTVKVKRSPSVSSGHQHEQGFRARNPEPNAIHPTGLRPWHSGSWVNPKNNNGTMEQWNNGTISYQGKKIDLTPPWILISVDEACRKFANFSLADITQKLATAGNCVIYSVNKIAKLARQKGYSVSPENTWEELFNQIFLNEVEPQINKHDKPTILYDYPAPMAALAKLDENDPRIARRFELYCAGLELADGYEELTDVSEQKTRLQSSILQMKKLGKKTSPVDGDFLQALSLDLPVCSGAALGIDRLVMLFTNAKTINEVLLFPISDMLE